MMVLRYLVLVGASCASLVFATMAFAENEGQEDLDKATELQLSVNTPADLDKVITLCESALKKGLDEDNTSFAKQLLVSSLWQRSQLFSSAIFNAQRPNPRWPLIRQMVLKDLNKLVGHDAKFVDAYVLMARLQTLPQGDLDKGMKAITSAIDLYDDDDEKRSDAYVLRARMQKEPEAQMSDLSEAIKLNPSNTNAWQTRAALFLARGELEKAVDDFERLLDEDDDNVIIHQAVAEALTNLKKYDLAMEHVNKAIELEPDLAINYILKSRVHEGEDKTDEALADLGEALRVDPSNGQALLTRAAMLYQNQKFDEARADVDRALRDNPGWGRAILLRSLISASSGRVVEAIADVQRLLRGDPGNVELNLQLATYYVADQRPRKAITLLDKIIEQNEDSAAALRARADAYLSVGKHAEAVSDYDRAFKVAPDNDGILNNLAWVLATSPMDEVRDADRAIELATKACEVTEYQMPHILSTLAAAYAEKGDFENAIKWSSKAVELGRDKLKAQIEQLEAELESYKKGEKWRELQDVEEKADPPRRVIET